MTPADALARLAADYWDVHLEAQPVQATVIGDPRFDDRLPDPTPRGMAATLARLAPIADRASALDADPLEAADRVTLSALRGSIADDRSELETGLLEWNVDHLDGLPSLFLNIPAYQRLVTPDDGRRMVARWREMAGYTDRHVATLRASLADGRVACRAPAERVAESLARLLATPIDEWPLLEPLATIDRLDGWTEADRQRFVDDLRSAVETGIRPAFARHHDALVTDILPAARPAERPGMCHVPGGEAGYRQLVRLHTSLDEDPETLHRVGLDEIDRIDAELGDLAGRTIGARSLADALGRLRSDPALYFTTRDEVFDKAATSLARAVEAIPDWFGRLPQARCDVTRIGAHEEDHTTIAYYRQPAADGSRPGQFFINTGHPGTRPRYEAEALAYHESVPGHHLQIAISQELPGLPAFRRHLGPTAFVEGWGLYTERLADEMGLYTGDLDRIGVLSYDAWRASRLVVDTGMHALGWPRERAVSFMLEHTALAPNNIANEVDRYIALPGQALGYKVGQLELLRLRADAAQRLGTAFDIRAFHDTVLGNGAVALATLREIVEAWVTGPGAPA